MNTTTEIISGKQITQVDLDIINKYRKIRLNRKSHWDHFENNYFHDRLFFLVRSENKLVSFGTLRQIDVYIDDEKISIMGIQAVISVVERKGYGKILMQEMINYAERENKTLVGFCESKNAEFYKKSGLEVFQNQNRNFVYVNENNDEYTEDGDVIFYSSNKSTIKDALIQNKPIKHFIPHW